MSRKLLAARQLSLQCESPPAASRPRLLRKQYSEDVPDPESDIRIALGAKGRIPRDDLDRPPPIRVAWCENKSSKTNNKGGDSDIIMYTRQSSKTNLNIFLAHQHQVDDEQEEQDDQRTPRLIPHQMQPEIQKADCKNIFQKHLRNRSNTQLMNDKPADTIIVVPIIERTKPLLVPSPTPPPPPHRKEEQDTTTEIDEVEGCSSERIERPVTSAQNRRELFKKRANSAFHATVNKTTHNFRPPLIRASSVPNRTEAKPKFLANKRSKLKTKRKEKQHHDHEEEVIRKGSGGDVVTMVSLISSSESEQEDENKEPTKQQSPKKTNLKQREDKLASVRKAGKSVTFQQSTIHAVRSFSASFPSRRASIATTILLGNAAKKLNAQAKSQEKRATLDDDEIAGPKRRLVRSATTDLGSKSVDGNEVKNEAPAEKRSEETFPITSKEKECWETYRRMNERGINVSFDTILRGMLTPTEYRERKKLNNQQQSAEN